MGGKGSGPESGTKRKKVTRDKLLSVRLTQDERQMIIDKAKLAGMSQADFILKKCLR